MKRRTFVGAIAATLAMPHYARGQSVREFRVGSPNVTGSVQHEGLIRFAERVAELSGGRYKVNIHMDSSIGDMAQLISGMQLGTVDMSLMGIGNGAGLQGGAPLNIAFTPYLFNSKQDAQRILTGPIFAGIFDELAARSGMRAMVIAGPRSGRALQTTKGPILHPDDVKGLRIRFPPIDLARVMFETLEATPVSMGANEIYLALSRDQIDGQDNGYDVSIPYKWHEVAPYWSATDHVFELGVWYASERTWQSLPAADQEMFSAAAAEGGALIGEITEEIDRNGKAELMAAGVTVVEPDLDAFREKLADVHKSFEGTVWPDGLVAEIRALQG